ncbi:unnamed protein product [Adineta steineri]|uniref:G-protein coupled receptors family 1 profile domain-containing protein n=1 Tax=Adineta steineri TaxID=433720 RepID=A0A819EVP1_9BILA|nr:unnamed protein product [Adineta steineri]CAF3856616.1 unnamed protein product [Adineta steineri]
MTDSLISLGAQLTRITLPMIIIMGVVGNSLNIAVLLRPVFYSHACSRYLLAASINSVIYSSVVLIYQLLVTGYQLDPSTISVMICKVMTYVFHVTAYISPYNIVFASMERYFSSSTSVYLRNFSSIRISRWIIGCIVGFFVLFGINTFVLITANPNDGLGCQIPDGKIYNQIYVVTQAMLYAIIAPFLMGLFGYLTMRNLKQVRVTPVVVSKHRRTERQLIRMLLLQVSIYIMLNLPVGVTYLSAVLPVSYKTTPLFFLVADITEILTYASNSSSFIIYMIGNRCYREELMVILRTLFRMKQPVNNRIGTQSTTTKRENFKTIAIIASMRVNNPVQQTYAQ